MEKKFCRSCGLKFRPHPQTPHQEYCSADECQRERRRRSQQRRRNKDADYRENDSRNNKDWAARNPDYWKWYRKNNPAYVERNRQLQQNRNRNRRTASIANVDASSLLSSLPSGRYVLTPYREGMVANVDAWIVEITVLSVPCRDSDT